jgi:hypothetical protein
MTVGTFAQGQMGALQSSAFQPTVKNMVKNDNEVASTAMADLHGHNWPKK